jgi:hypothetical protein
MCHNSKRFSLFLKSQIGLASGLTANNIQFDLSTLNNRFKANKRLILTLHCFSFFDVAVSGAHHVAFSISIPEFIQDGIIVSSSGSTNTALQTAPCLAIIAAEGNNSNLKHTGNGADGVEGYFTTNIITVRIEKMPANDATTLNPNVNWGMHLTLEEAE